MGKESLLRVVGVHVPGRTGCGIKVVMPMLVKCIIGVGYGVDQTIVQHLGGSCRACQAVSTSSTCLDLMLCKANMAQATKACACKHRISSAPVGLAVWPQLKNAPSTICATEQTALSGADAHSSTCAHKVMHGCVKSSNAEKRQLQRDLAVCSIQSITWQT